MSNNRQNRQNDGMVTGFAMGVGAALAAGYAFYQLYRGNPLVQGEQLAQDRGHNVTHDEASRNENLPLLDYFIEGEKVWLCYRENRVSFRSFTHWGVTNGRYYLEFGSAEVDHDQARVRIIPRGTETEGFQQYPGPEGTMNEGIRMRMREVLGMNNYSILHRNCEHVANYVFYGIWFSRQTSIDNLYMFERFVTADRLANMQNRPHGLTVNERINEEAQIYSFAESKKLEFMAVEYHFNGNLRDLAVLLVGHTGAGKSSLINVLYNRKLAATYETNMEAITREVCFHRGRRADHNVIVADSMGFCDRKVDEALIHGLIRDRVRNNFSTLDAIIFVFDASQPFPETFFGNAKKMLSFLKFNASKGKAFYFIGTKMDKISLSNRNKIKHEKRYELIERLRPLDVSKVKTLFLGFPQEEPGQHTEEWRLANESLKVLHEILDERKAAANRGERHNINGCNLM